ncbi:ribonuclease PH [Rickettsiales bacterium]|nr:ribonuclease PH [Rickettsiales bacterium]
MRNFNRKHNELRKVLVDTSINKFADGACLISFGDTKVICTATIEKNVPKWLQKTGEGWVTAEYNMLPTATKERTTREVKLGKQSGRTMEIQRLIGRSLRSIINLKKLSNIQITIDCDVLQADGGTRTASITGAFIALCIAVGKLINSGLLKQNPIFDKVAAVSAGLLDEGCFLDLDFIEDSNAIADANFVFSEKSGIVEIQVSGEKRPISKSEFDDLYQISQDGIAELFKIQSKYAEKWEI